MRKEKDHSSGDGVAGYGLINRRALLGRGDALQRILCVVALTMFVSLPARAQGYPVKPVTFITPAAAGNSPDVGFPARSASGAWLREVVERTSPLIAQPSRRWWPDRCAGRGRS